MIYCLAEIRVWASKVSRVLICNLYGHFYYPYFDDVWEIKWKIPVSLYSTLVENIEPEFLKSYYILPFYGWFPKSKFKEYKNVLK